MADWGATLDDRRVAVHFDRIPEDVHQRLYSRLVELEQRLAAAVRSGEPVRTGLLQSETGGQVYDRQDRITAVIGVHAGNRADYAKAGALEYGAHGEVDIATHQAMLGHLWGRPISPITVQVGAHQRHANIPAHRFLRDPIEEFRQQAIDDIRSVVQGVGAEA